MLTWWQGYIPPQGFGEGEEIIDNTSYQQVGRVHAGNGYKADLHDFHITPRSTALIDASSTRSTATSRSRRARAAAT